MRVRHGARWSRWMVTPGKLMLYQLSYSRAEANLRIPATVREPDPACKTGYASSNSLSTCSRSSSAKGFWMKRLPGRSIESAE